MPKFAPKPRCPLRPDDYCSLCVPGASGPQNCGLVYLVMSDPEAKELYRKKRLERQARLKAEKVGQQKGTKQAASPRRSAAAPASPQKSASRAGRQG